MQTIVIVDPRPGDFAEFVAEAARFNVACRLCATAEEALRISTSVRPWMWLINTVLPDMPGMALMAEIKSLHAGQSMCLVADRYTPSAEVAVRAAAAAFLCKPARRFAALLGLDGDFQSDAALCVLPPSPSQSI